MRIPAIDLNSLIAEVEGDWKRHLGEMLGASQFILGEQVRSFETEFASAMGGAEAVGVGTGTSAIEIGLRDALRDRGRSCVLTSALTSPFTAVAIQCAGHTPVFCDIDPDTLHMNVADAGNRWCPNTAAILPVNLYGDTADLSAIAALARDRNLAVVQDACQAHGATRGGKPLTAFSPYVTYSFYPTKNLGALGDGGAIVTNEPNLAARLRSLRDGGRRGDQVAHIRGINSRLDEMQACFLRAGLRRLTAWNQRRRELAAIYDEALAGCPGVTIPRRSPESVVHLYVIRAEGRDALRAHLTGRGIGSGIHYDTPLHLHPAFADCGAKPGDFPHAERACREILSLPLYPRLGADAVSDVAEEIRRYYS